MILSSRSRLLLITSLWSASNREVGAFSFVGVTVFTSCHISILRRKLAVLSGHEHSKPGMRCSICAPTDRPRAGLRTDRHTMSPAGIAVLDCSHE